MNVRVMEELQFISMLSRGVQEVAPHSVLRGRFSDPRSSEHPRIEEGGFSTSKWTSHQSPSIILRQAVCPSSLCRPVEVMFGGDCVQSSRTLVVDMIALDTDTDPDTDNSAPADAPPPRLWNEAAGQESETDSLMSFNGSTGPDMGKLRRLWKRKSPLTISGCLQHSTTHLPVWTKSIWRQSFATQQQ